MLGTFSGAGLGFGMAFVLEDFFNGTADEIERGMDKLDGNAAKVSASVQRSMDKIKLGASLAAAGAALIAPFVLSIKNASDYEENINKLDATFGKYADRVRAFVDNDALLKSGMSKNQAAESTSLFGDMATGIGFAADKAADMSIKLAKLEGDLTSFKNLEAGRAQTVLKGIFTGETESLKGLGVIMTKTRLQAFTAAQGINKAFKDLSATEQTMIRMQFVMNATRNSMGDFERTSLNYANASRIAKGGIENLSISMGQILMPIATKLMLVGAKLFNALDKFAQSAFGKWVLTSVAVLGAFLFVAGITLVLVGGLRFGIVKLAGAFGDKTKATIVATIAQHGFAAGLRSVGVAMWSTLGPVLIIVAAVAALSYIGYKAIEMMKQGTEMSMRWGAGLLFLLGPIGWVIAAIVGIQQGMKNWLDDSSELETSGIIGFFNKIAGVILAAGQIWASFNGETFTLTKRMADGLESLGILDFVLKMGTYISRVKIIWDAVIAGFTEGFKALGWMLIAVVDILGDSFMGIWESLGTIFTSLGVVIRPLITLFHTLTGGMFDGVGALSGWALVGKILTEVIIFGFKMVANTILIVVQAIAWLIEGTVFAISKIVEFFAWLVSTVIGFIDTLLGAIFSIVDVVFSVYGALFSAGADLLGALWGGFRSMFPAMAAWITESINTLVANVITPIADKVIAGFKAVKSFLGFGDEEEEEGVSVPKIPGEGSDDPINLNPNGGGGAPTPRGLQSTTSKTPIVVTNNNTSTSNESSVQPIILQTVLDGDIISEKMVDSMELKQARN